MENRNILKKCQKGSDYHWPLKGAIHKCSVTGSSDPILEAEAEADGTFPVEANANQNSTIILSLTC